MDRRSSQLARRIGGGAFLIALALVFGRSLHHAPEVEPPFEEAAKSKTAATAASPAADSAAPVSAQPRAPRPLDVADVPPPGAARRTPRAAAAPAEYPASAVPSYSARSDGSGYASPSFPSGGRAPAATSSLGLAALPAEERESAPAPTRAAQTASKPGSDAGRPPARSAGGDAPDPALDPRAALRAAGFVSQARGLKNGAQSADDLTTPAGIRQAIDKEVTVEHAVDQDLRRSLSGMSPSADIEQQRGAAAAVLAAHGQPTDEKSITNALGAALQPPPPAGAPPSDAGSRSPSASDFQPEEPPYIPTEVPPRGLGPIYHKYQDAFDKAFKQFGVPPWDILALGQQESGFGANMGKTPLPKGVARRPADMAAAEALNRENRLPAPWQRLQGSETGALGPFQFEPSTQRSAGKGNPFDWTDQISYSVPHLLILNGYKPNDPVAQRKAYGRYYGDGNPNGKYALSVAAHSAAIKPVIVQAMREPAPAK
ncbi:MAG TPA: lytic murein transglycosylase [Elusimicrobiota bacterium]|nr:lytic murein transglycosylase [Elusimicrobiota bacterium]